MSKVLVVDDEPSVRELVKTYLEYADLSVSSAGNGLEALELLKKENYDVVVSDIQMPHMDGLTLAGEVHKLQPDTVVILMTGYASVNTAVEAIKQNVFDYIMKPFQNMQILQQTVMRGIEHRQMIHERRALTDDLKRINNELDHHRKLLQREVIAIDSELSRRVQHLTTLFDISRSTRSITNLDDLLNNIMNSISSTMPDVCGALWLADTERKKLNAVVINGVENTEMVPRILSIDEGDLGESVRIQRVRLFNSVDQLSDPLFKALADAEKASALIMVPLLFENKVLGAFCVMYRNGVEISDEDVNLLSAIANQVSVSIMNAELYASQQQLFRETIEALATAIDSRDHYTGGHSYMVTRYSLLIADALGFDDDQKELIRVAGLLHDVGKIGITDSILNKPGKLTDEEMNIIKSHPILGRVILESIDALRPVAKLVYHHHERYDGKGYPEGIAGKKIPLESRILQIADIFHALTSDRIYRKAMPLEKALGIIRDESGTTFDPQLSELFLQLSTGEEFQELISMT